MNSDYQFDSSLFQKGVIYPLTQDELAKMPGVWKELPITLSDSKERKVYMRVE